jgi:hypothetical protein
MSSLRAQQVNAPVSVFRWNVLSFYLLGPHECHHLVLEQTLLQ